jgi:Protein of unknown function (DUF1559)
LPFTAVNAPSGTTPPVPIIGTYTCPDDVNNNGIAGGLSYAANAGYVNSDSFINVNPNPNTITPGTGTPPAPVTPPTGPPDYGTDAHDSTTIAWSELNPPNTATTPTDNQTLDEAIAHATGVFWRQDVSGFNMTTDYIQSGDGATNTIMLGENVDSGYWADITFSTGTPPVPLRRDLQTGYIGFGVSVAVTPISGATAPPLFTVNNMNPTGSFGSSATQNANGYLYTPSAATGAPTYALCDSPGTTGVNDADINSNILTATQGFDGRASSNHPGLVCMCFCDGHASALSQNIDVGVYMRALSPGGTIYGQPVDGDVK